MFTWLIWFGHLTDYATIQLTYQLMALPMRVRGEHTVVLLGSAIIVNSAHISSNTSGTVWTYLPQFLANELSVS